MSRRSNVIPGLRQPTVQERKWIADHWGKEARERNHHSKGKLPKYLGIFLIATGAVNMTRGTENLAETLVLLVLSAVCLWFSSVARSSARRANLRAKALQEGGYQVAKAMAHNIRYSRNQKTYDGLVNISLPDGTPLEGVYKIPYDLAMPLLEQKVSSVPVLLIQISGDDEILAIPVQK